MEKVQSIKKTAYLKDLGNKKYRNHFDRIFTKSKRAEAVFKGIWGSSSKNRKK